MVVCSIIVRRLRPDCLGKLAVGHVLGRASALRVRGVTSTPVTFAGIFPPKIPHASSLTVYPVSERKYTDKHEWVQVEGKIGTIGITQYAQVSVCFDFSLHPPGR
jgi:Glycine cleavage H-protein